MISIKRDTLIILQIFILIIIGFLIKDRLTSVKENFILKKKKKKKKKKSSTPVNTLSVKKVAKPTIPTKSITTSKTSQKQEISDRLRLFLQRLRQKQPTIKRQNTNNSLSNTHNTKISEKNNTLQKLSNNVELAKKNPNNKTVLFLEASNEISDIFSKDINIDEQLKAKDEKGNNKFLEKQYIVIENEGEYTKKDLEELYSNYIDKRIKSIVLKSGNSAILYEGEKFDKFRPSYVLNKSSELVDKDWFNKTSSFKITNSPFRKLEQEARLNNQIFLFDDENYTGQIVKISIPNRELKYPRLLKESIEIKSIIIPEDRNIELVFNDNPTFKYEKNNPSILTDKVDYDGKIVKDDKGKTIQIGRLVTRYQIKALDPNLDVSTPFKILRDNDIELDKIKNRLHSVILEKKKQNENINEQEKIRMDSMIERLVNDIKKKRNSLLYEINK